MMDKTCHFLCLPNEILCIIVSYLSEDDKLAFKFAYPHFCGQYRYLNAREAFSFNNESLTKLLRHHFNPDVLTELDFNFCYWISSKDISNFARRCKNLEELSVVHSNLTIRDLIHILQEDTKITKLRLSINSQKEFWLTDHITMKKSVGMPSDQSSYGTAWKNLFLVCEFEKCRLTMSKLTSLDLQMGQDPIVLGTILSGCGNLSNLCLRLGFEEEKLHSFKVLQLIGKNSIGLSQDVTFDSLEEYWSHPPPCNLKSIILLDNTSSRKRHLRMQMERFIQQVVGQGSSDLQCVWTNITGLSARDARISVKEMIAWKEAEHFGHFVPPPMPTIESLACKKFMQTDDFYSPNLKQIECGFWKDTFENFCRAHPALERLRLNKRPCEVSELYSIIDWSPLPKLKVMSLHPRIIYASDYLQSSWMRGRADRTLSRLLKAYQGLEELEICPDFYEKPDIFLRNSQDTYITADSLWGLTLCTSLRKFTLNSVTISYKQTEINDPSFLEELVTKCPSLEALNIQELNIHLTHWGRVEKDSVVLDTLYNDCIERCCLALRSARKLRILRWKLRVVSRPFDQLIRLLAYCPSLIQLGLIATSVQQKLDMYSWNTTEFTAFFIDVVEHLPKLVALLVVLPDAPISLCRAATSTLEVIFRPTRPSFCAQITDSLDNTNPPSLPLIHYQTLARDPSPSVGELPFHLTLSNSRY